MAQYIVVHSGARDQYKLAESLYKNGKLGYLVTDDILFRKAYKNLFPRDKVKICWSAFIIRMILKFHNFGEDLSQFKQKLLGIKAGKLSKKCKMPLMALQEYAYHAYKYSDVRPRVVFQYHPQAQACKQIFEEEIERHPDWDSFQKEVAIYTPKKIQEATDELQETDYFIAASTFTKRTLVENMQSEKPVFVAPYGVETNRYPYKEREVPKIVTFVFVGSFVERKGIFYLLNAAKKLEEEGNEFKLEITGRSPVGVPKLEAYGLKNMKINVNLSHQELIEKLHDSDVFVFPSLFEGYAFVIVEAMSTGLPVITTPRTVGADVISDGEEGFLVAPSDEKALYERMKFFIEHPSVCPEMGKRASEKAKALTWQNFEDKVIEAVEKIEEDSH